MLTQLGKFLRKLRIDKNEILKDMADKLGVTVSFLSAVENGKKRMPSSWNTKICELYDLDDNQEDEFTKAIAKSENKIDFDMQDVTIEQKEIAVSFARKFSDFDERQIQKIKNIMKGSDNK